MEALTRVPAAPRPTAALATKERKLMVSWEVNVGVELQRKESKILVTKEKEEEREEEREGGLAIEKVCPRGQREQGLLKLYFMFLFRNSSSLWGAREHDEELWRGGLGCGS